LIGFIGWLNLLDWLNRESERIPRGLPRGRQDWGRTKQTYCKHSKKLIK
jgi:hypothetical protein